MDITEEIKVEVEQILKKTDCQNDFACYRSGFEDVSKANLINNGKLVECLEEKAKYCNNSFSFGNGRFCKCPLRLYIAKKFNK